MPTVNVARDLLFKALGRTYTKEEFELLCFEFGIELDDVTSEKEMIEKETGSATSAASEEVLYKIDVPANRYDLLCLEGLSRALRIFTGKMAIPNYRVCNPQGQPLQRLVVHPSVREVRPVLVAAILRNIAFSRESYNSFIDLQEKLHQNICKKRSLVSIGTHDLGTIKGPFSYEAQQPKDIRFKALKMDRELNAEDLFKHFNDTENHLKKYLHIIADCPLYPVIYDSNRVVLSLPPIINGEHSKITLNTKNVLIEVTATDYTKANIVLNTMVTMFAEYCDPIWSVEQVEVVDTEGRTTLFPDMSPRHQTADVGYIASAIGLSPKDLPPTDIATLLNRMCLPAELVDGGRTVRVAVPPTRSDVAIAYGFNKLPHVVPETVTVGKQQPLNKLCDLLRTEIAQAGYTEILAWTLCSKDDNFRLLNRPDSGQAVLIDNPKTVEFQCGRLTLLSGILKSVAANKSVPLPIKVFEVGEGFGKDASSDTGAANKRLVSALYCNTTSGFEVIHGLVDRIMLLLRIPPKTKETNGYFIRPSDDGAFFQGRRADICLDDKKVGVFGVLHPNVLRNYARLKWRSRFR